MIAGRQAPSTAPARLSVGQANMFWSLSQHVGSKALFRLHGDRSDGYYPCQRKWCQRGYSLRRTWACLGCHHVKPCTSIPASARAHTYTE